MGRGTDNDHPAVERPMALRGASTEGVGTANGGDNCSSKDYEKISGHDNERRK
jgi:hypothetical protein